MGGYSVSRKFAIISLALSYSGLVVFAAGVILTMYLEPLTTELRLAFLVPGLAIFSCGSYIMSKKTRCPCADEVSGRRSIYTPQRRLVTIRSIRKGYYTCPVCEKTVEFK